MTATTTAKPRKRAGAVKGARTRDAGDMFMRLLREDHAGLSLVLREVDAQQSALRSTPATARPVLLEAMRYLLVYQHSVHHPREDQLFARIREREPLLYRNIAQLVREHRVGQERAEGLARELARATLDELRGTVGARLSRQLQDYVRHTRNHMRREETVFYTGSARVLRASDWAALTAGPMPQDPAGDLHRLAARYPRLAARLGQAERAVTGHGEHEPRAQDRPGIRQRAELVAEFYGEVLHDTAELARLGIEDLRKVRTPLGLARASVDMSTRGFSYALKLARRPFRR
jgi:hemerythrin-like domain-containing protein